MQRGRTPVCPALLQPESGLSLSLAPYPLSDQGKSPHLSEPQSLICKMGLAPFLLCMIPGSPLYFILQTFVYGFSSRLELL